MTNRTKQHGSAVVIIIVVVIGLALIGALGYLGYKAMTQASTDKENTSSNSKTEDDTSTTPEAAASDESEAQSSSSSSESLIGIRIGMTKAEAEKASGLTGLACSNASDGSEVCHNEDYSKMITYKDGKVTSVIADKKVLSADGKVRDIQQ